MNITDNMIQKKCSGIIYRRGLEYFKEGRVHIRKRGRDNVSAVVDGEARYNVAVSYNDSEITDFFCTCPYHETMGAMCKHIVAVLKLRQAELQCEIRGEDDNDKLSAALCSEFRDDTSEKDFIPIGFTMYFQNTGNIYDYSMSIETSDGFINGIEKFLDSFIRKKEYRMSKNVLYKPGKTQFGPAAETIISILAESYENKSGGALYRQESHRTFFGSFTAKRLFPMLNKTNFKFRSVLIGGSSVNIREEDPDILIDVNANDGEIGLSVSDKGAALTPDGEWFLFEEDIYHTTEEWRGKYMPFYRALSTDNRTELSFKGDNALNFARFALPKIRGMHGVILHGVDDIIVDEKPVFSVYLDAADKAVTAVVRVKYGDIILTLPRPEAADDRIIIRDEAAEREILSYFEDFTEHNGIFVLKDDALIFDFFDEKLSELGSLAEIFVSDAFKTASESSKVSFSAEVLYDDRSGLFETVFETDISPEELWDLLRAIELRERFFRLENGRFADLKDIASNKAFNLISDLELTKTDIKNMKKTVPKYKALYLNALAESGAISQNKKFREYINNVKSQKAVIPAGLETVLREYQKEGMNWMKQLSYLGFGGILADDMGLGKTLQVIAYTIGEDPDRQVLVVAPSALVYNWRDEIKKFAPEQKALVISGDKETRHRLISESGEYRFIITSYALLRRDIDEYENISFSYCFIDEAQYIKNPRTMNAHAVKRIRADNKFALTGTPIENSLMELWSIFDFVAGGYLGSRESFKKRFGVPSSGIGSDEALSALKEKISPFIMRRMKSDVLSELPEKMEYAVAADMTDSQKAVYGAYLYSSREQVKAMLTSKEASRLDILTLLLRLRQICCHPRLISEDYGKDSGKLMLLEELVTSGVRNGHRILIFSQFTSMLSIISEKMKKLGISFFRIDGSTPPQKRVEYAGRFNDGENDAFLISLKAGGTGLNLTGADTVIHYDPWWNPAVMDQASDRAYRIGQEKSVQIIKLFTANSIEEKILKLQEKKRALAENIIRAEQGMISSLTDEEILELFQD